jgi:hypothetical protein
MYVSVGLYIIDAIIIAELFGAREQLVTFWLLFFECLSRKFGPLFFPRSQIVFVMAILSLSWDADINSSRLHGGPAGGDTIVCSLFSYVPACDWTASISFPGPLHVAGVADKR